MKKIGHGVCLPLLDTTGKFMRMQRYKASPFRLGRGFLAGWILLCLAGCSTSGHEVSSLVRQAGSKVFFQGVALREGDIFLTRGGDPISAVLAWHVATPGPYSHSGVFFRDENGVPLLMNIQRNGMVVAPLSEALLSYARVAIFRSKEEGPSARNLGRILRSWHEKNRENHVESDLSLRKMAKQNNSFSCVTLVNEIYKESHLVPPFVMESHAPIDRWIQWANGKSGMELEKMPTANSLLSNSMFQEVFTWENPHASQRRVNVYDVVADQAYQYMLSGDKFRSPRWAQRAWIRSLRVFGVIDKKSSFLMGMKAVFTEYAFKVHRAYCFRAQKGSIGEDALEEEVRYLCNVYKEDYFVSFDRAVESAVP